MNSEQPNKKESVEQAVRENFETIVLSMLQQAKMGGYDILKGINQKYNLSLTPGTVYPFLYSLKDRGALRSELRSTSQVYALTEHGRKMLEEKLSELEDVKHLIIGDNG